MFLPVRCVCQLLPSGSSSDQISQTAKGTVMTKAMTDGTTCIVAIVLGLAVAIQDSAAPFGDDSSKITLLLLIVSSGLIALVRPRRPWLWGILVGVWLPPWHLAGHALGLHTHIHPDSYSSILLLVPVSLAVCVIAACCASVVRRVFVS
jgi:hypothetical protein